MSAATDSTTDPMLVYVRLLGEGTSVYRPAHAETRAQGVVRLLCPEDYDPDGEDWEFKPGATVRVELRSLSDGEVLVAVAPA